MKIEKFKFNPFEVNTYVIFDETKEAIVIDPGFENQKEQEIFEKFLSDNQLKLVKILCTHCHIDHILGIDFLKNKYNIPFCANKNDEETLQNTLNYAQIFGLKVEKIPQLDINLAENDKIIFGNSELNILEVPGHSEGHLAFYSTTEKIIFTGDTLFKDTIGRTDLPGGNLDTLLQSIEQKILKLGDEFIILPGHGPSSNVGYEKLNNQFI